MRFSPIVPLIVIGLFAFFLYGTRRISKGLSLGGQRLLSVYSYLGVLFAWAIVSTFLAVNGVYFEKKVLQFVPLLLGASVPITLICLWLSFSQAFRETVSRLLLDASLPSLIYIHTIRISAIGTIIKYFKGELPAHFIIPVGFGDLLMGLSAPVIGYLVSKKRLSPGPTIAWNVIGVLIYLAAGPLLHVSVPGPLQVFFEGPTTAEVFHFPLALVPTVIVPMFLFIHGATIWKLRQTKGPLSTG